MSHPIIIPWLPINTTLIAPLQTLAAAGSLALNSKVPGLPQGPFIYDRVIRDISLTSSNDLHLVNFTITGIGSPVDADINPTQVLGLISETIAGPLGTGVPVSVDSANIYSQIISITADAPAAGISAGSGPNGITDYVFLDYNRTIFQTSVQLQFNPRTTASVTVFESLTKPQTIDINAGNLINVPPVTGGLAVNSSAFPVSVALTGATTKQLGVLISPVAITWAAINASSTDSITFTVLQQGVN